MKLILGDGQSKTRNMSDQPISCPLCGAMLRQSRNLRRHLELLHFGLGNGSKAGLHVRHRRNDRGGNYFRPSLPCIRTPHAPRTDSHHPRANEHSDFPTMTPLSVPSTVSSGNLMGPGSSVLGSAEQNAHSLSTVSATSCGVSMGPANNGIYTSDTSASMLGCLLPSLPSLPSLSSPHDVFRHGEMLRAYHDPSRQHARHLQRTDVT